MVLASVQIPLLGYRSQVLFHIPIQDQVCISQRIFVDQVIQLGTLSGAVAIQVLDLNAVESESAAVGIAQLHTGGVHVVCTGE